MIPPQTSRNPESDRLAGRVARLEEQFSAAAERIGQLVQENTRLREENRYSLEKNRKLRQGNARLKAELAAARKDSSSLSPLRASSRRTT